MSVSERGRAGRAITAIAGVVLFISLFLTWSSPGHGFLVQFGALNRSGGYLGNARQTAWQVYSVEDIALAAVAGFFVLAAGVRRTRVVILASVAAAAALVFSASQFLDPPSVGLPGRLPRGAAALVARTGLTSASSGAGEIVAMAASVAALGGVGLVWSIKRS